MAEKKNIAKKPAEKTTKTEPAFLFHKENYILMAAGFVVLVIGFWLMSGKEDIFSTTKLTIAPIVVVIGFVIEFVAILRKPKDGN